MDKAIFKSVKQSRVFDTFRRTKYRERALQAFELLQL